MLRKYNLLRVVPSPQMSTLSVYLPDSIQGGLLSAQAAASSTPLSLSPSPPLSFIPMCRIIGDFGEKEITRCVRVCMSPPRETLPLPLPPPLRAEVDVAGGKKEGQNLARLRVTRLCCLRAREATWMEGGSGMAICYRRHHRRTGEGSELSNLPGSAPHG